MTPFHHLNLPAVMDTSSNDLTSEFLMPLLSSSLRYDRDVGFFGSGWLLMNASGIIAFAMSAW